MYSFQKDSYSSHRITDSELCVFILATQFTTDDYPLHITSKIHQSLQLTAIL
jgi:hypothetical protein